MWRIAGTFLTSYLWLCLLSVICMGHPFAQRLLLLLWIVRVAWIMEAERQNGKQLGALLGLLAFSQLPGILLVFFSGWYAVARMASEWPSGLMEIWYHPFIYLLELLPSRRLGEWSDLYLATSLVPILMLLSCSLCWLILKRFKTRWVRRLH
ncbi:hypothetical protein [Alicyclobacillus ferrooxydans]|uniref:Uncharacterized protein n=1 Tax=Alicyclobacillus ferrooxydans TaxID=471514 RepID=A0A0P9CJ96_9BACL|nr:hypothetical protein [Alicyclobacillus ferrooxydans]KPV43081.1 hypothetical protein AN477_14180 [Alicyclobacillus ferrooxydans]